MTSEDALTWIGLSAPREVYEAIRKEKAEHLDNIREHLRFLGRMERALTELRTPKGSQT